MPNLTVANYMDRKARTISKDIELRLILWGLPTANRMSRQDSAQVDRVGVPRKCIPPGAAHICSVGRVKRVVRLSF